MLKALSLSCFKKLMTVVKFVSKAITARCYKIG